MKSYRPPQSLSLSHIHNHSTIFTVIAAQLQKFKENQKYIEPGKDKGTNQSDCCNVQETCTHLYTHIHNRWKIARCD